ncbi:MAG: hypothetical protein WCB14_21380 [Candidatus Acidiferrales bacterium]
MKTRSELATPVVAFTMLRSEERDLRWKLLGPVKDELSGRIFRFRKVALAARLWYTLANITLCELEETLNSPQVSLSWFVF